MKATEAMLCWGPAPHAAAVVRWPDTRNLSDAFELTDLACEAAFRETDDAGRMLWMLRTAWRAAINDGIDPEAVHAALLAVDEYRAAFGGGQVACRLIRTGKEQNR